MSLLLPDSGLLIASIAEPPILPIPKPAPITASPAPSAAPNLLIPLSAVFIGLAQEEHKEVKVKENNN